MQSASQSIFAKNLAFFAQQDIKMYVYYYSSDTFVNFVVELMGQMSLP